MKRLNYKNTLNRANEYYIQAKAEKGLVDLKYTAPELFPRIQSDSIKVVIRIMVEEINQLNERIDKLENYVLTKKN